MKFAAVLRDSVADLPDTEDLFRKYKQLKKALKGISTGAKQGCDGASLSESNTSGEKQRIGASTHQETTQDGAGHNDGDDDDVESTLNPVDPAMEAAFLRAITADVKELNERYIEKEEDNVISFGTLEEGALAASTPTAKAAAHRAFINFHGELLMLFHWSILAYTSLVKILKKHRKRTGTLLKAPHLENLLSQPFCSVEVTCDMIRRAERHVSTLAESLNVSPLLPAQFDDVVMATVAGNKKSSEGTTSPMAAMAVAVSPLEQDNNVPQKEGQAMKRKFEDRTEHDCDHGGFDLNTHVKLAKESNPIIVAKNGDATSRNIVSNIEENKGTRRVKAALYVWQQLQLNAVTPSTMIAPGLNTISQPLPSSGDRHQVRSTMTNSSVA